MISVVVPYRGTDPQRERVWAWCEQWWRSQRPGAELVVVDSGDEPFSRGASLNRGVDAATGDVVVLADADVVVGDLTGALDLLYGGDAPWVIAHARGGYHALTREATERLLRVDPSAPLAVPLAHMTDEVLTCNSACLVLWHSDFERIDGFDERMVGWGHEDDIFRAKADTLLGAHGRPDGWAMHLWHEHREAERFQQPYIGHNRALSDRYAAVEGDPQAMESLMSRARDT